MNPLRVLSVALLLLLTALLLVSGGTTRGPQALWWIGLALLGTGLLIPPLLRLRPRPAPGAAREADESDVAEEP